MLAHKFGEGDRVQMTDSNRTGTVLRPLIRDGYSLVVWDDDLSEQGLGEDLLQAVPPAAAPASG